MTDAPDHARIADRLASQGYAVAPDFLPVAMAARLADEARALRADGHMRRAGVGQAGGVGIHDELRSDSIHWLEQEHASPAQHAYLDALESLRLEVNRSLYLGLFDFEGHFAVYPPGAFYRKHLDRFRGDSRRTLTTVLYLNPDWQEAHGGKLRLYLDPDGAGPALDIPPQGGTLVTFLSGRFWHEVQPAGTERLSITGWFRTRGEGVL